ncbi:glycosyltransferase family 4 protein [Streptomyces sp. NBC_00102]|uniref:glycosyltransferase family 4 protein n=1 Tax=Streptomyces sp. NBC_00102 TaxID=2975652 RepID=UPI00224E7879|nr:glycosyltransferase family 4 protein [Streptomyces sp. NBC_00102]MCX5397188.1 glycosyltransferase family 4 protein [Streptomyces sp. NBC_00102]
MKIAMLNPPHRFGQDTTQWITVPPQGYGGIQWVVATLIDGLLHAGCEILLVGAPGSISRPGLTISDATTFDATLAAIREFGPDVVHDHTNGELLPADPPWPAVRTHHLNGVPEHLANGIYLSRAQRQAAGSADAPIIRLPVNPDRYTYRASKDRFLLFLGRVSVHKGARQAAAFAQAAGLPLKLAGPAWEPDYLHGILTDYPDTAAYVGEVGGTGRTELLALANALLVLSQPFGGPFGGEWIEPGATVVAEAAVSGTPVIATDNGCLAEIAPHVGVALPPEEAPDPELATKILAGLPAPAHLRATAIERWGHHVIAAKYLEVYRRAAAGNTWS